MIYEPYASYIFIGFIFEQIIEMTANNSERINSWLQHEPTDVYIKKKFVRGFEDDKGSFEALKKI